MNRKKGFTLVELLAVVTILGVIATIVTPIVKNYINDSKLYSAEASLKSVERAAKLYFTTNNVKNQMVIDLTNNQLQMKNNKIEKGYVIGTRKNFKIYLYKDGYCMFKEGKTTTIEKKKLDDCNFEMGGDFKVSPTNKIAKTETIAGYRIYGNTIDNISLGQTNKTITLKLSGKNMFDISKVISNANVINNGNVTLSVTPTSGSSGVAAVKPNTLKDYAPYLEIGKTYILSVNTTGNTKSIYFNISKRVWGFGKTITIKKEDFNSVVYWYANGTDTSFTAVISNIQIEEGSTATAYEPYLTPQEYTITLNEPLRKVGNAVDYIDSSISQIVRNVGVNADGTLYALDKPTYEYISLPSITNLNGTTVVSSSDGNIEASDIKVMLKK